MMNVLITYLSIAAIKVNLYMLYVCKRGHALAWGFDTAPHENQCLTKLFVIYFLSAKYEASSEHPNKSFGPHTFSFSNRL